MKRPLFHTQFFEFFFFFYCIIVRIVRTKYSVHKYVIWDTLILHNGMYGSYVSLNFRTLTLGRLFFSHQWFWGRSNSTTNLRHKKTTITEQPAEKDDWSITFAAHLNEPSASSQLHSVRTFTSRCHRLYSSTMRRPRTVDMQSFTWKHFTIFMPFSFLTHNLEIYRKSGNHLQKTKTQQLGLWLWPFGNQVLFFLSPPLVLFFSVPICKANCLGLALPPIH